MNQISTYCEGDWRTISDLDFEHRFLEICEAHRAQGRALAFAFVLFDRTHPYVRGVLAERRYWDALDERAGRHLSVFSLEVRPRVTSAPREMRGMHRIEAGSFEHHRDTLGELFGDVTRRDLPSVIFFQVDRAELVDALAVKLSAQGLYETYSEIEEVIGVGADAVAQVKDENAENAIEVFNLVRSALRDLAVRRRVLRLVELARPVGTIGGAMQFIRLILGL